MDAWMERWMEGWMDGLMDEVTKTSSKLLVLHFWGEAELFTFHDPRSIIALIKWMWFMEKWVWPTIIFLLQVCVIKNVCISCRD